MATTTPGSFTDEKTKSRRPKDTKFKQQKLPAWQPILTASTVLPAFFAIGIAFIPLGIGLLVTSNNVKESITPYTDCISNTSPTNETCASYIANKNNTDGCKCTVDIELATDFVGTVYMYYGLTNFFQNHRRYVKSRDDSQLKGDKKTAATLTSDCDPYTRFNETVGYAPCGAIANSMFDDKFAIHYKGKNNDKDLVVTLIKTGIAWTSDKKVKFHNPESWAGFTHPPKWSINVQDLDPDDPSNTGYENEDLIVWMRTAALPTFRKLFGRVNHTTNPEFQTGLPAGKYQVIVDYAFPVAAFDGTKRIIFTTTSWLGGKNPFLGVAYLVVGSICIILGLVFVIIHIKWGKKDKDMINISSETHY